MSAKPAASSKMGGSGAERRKTPRRPVLESFSLFVVVPKKGDHRLPVHDLSDQGVGFDIDMEGESIESFPVKSGETFELKLYLNQTLFIPLQVKVARIVETQGETGAVRRIGAEFAQKNTKAFLGLRAFVTLLDSLLETAGMD